jgi:hypothetical protein
MLGNLQLFRISYRKDYIDSMELRRRAAQSFVKRGCR